MMSESEFTTSMDVIRPLIPPGPIFLGAASLSQVVEKSCAPNCRKQHKKNKENIGLILVKFN